MSTIPNLAPNMNTRVMELEEIFSDISVDDFIWIEMREGAEKGIDEDDVFCLRVADKDNWLWVAHPMGLTDLWYEEYGKLWRVWNICPSDSDRFNTPWKEVE